MNKHYDIIIVGSGVAGLSTLLYLIASEAYIKGNLSIAVIAKGAIDETNTDWAQGGIAAVAAMQDNYEKHIEDTMNAGGYVNDIHIVKKVVQSGPAIMHDLLDWGICLDKKTDGTFDLVKEGGHSEARIWHYQDTTGHALQMALTNNIPTTQKLDLKTNNTVLGIEKDINGIFHLLNYHNETKFTENLSCDKLVLATGGLGTVFEKTTNQSIATGDGIYFSHHLGAKISNLSYIQFHPTGLYKEGPISFLISEALRGAGAILVNKIGESFMHQYDERGSLAPRDIVSRSILSEMQKTNSSHVYLDATKVDTIYLATHFPNIINKCKEILNLNIFQDLIPVIPTQHYSCGGIAVNEYGESTIAGLFAIGECANTGLHGANRLASNSLLEAIAFAKFATSQLLKKTVLTSSIIASEDIKLHKYKEIERLPIQKIISNHAGVTKSNKGLNIGLEALYQISDSAPFIEFDINNKDAIKLWENHIILELSIMLIKDALEQKKNIGVHYNVDLLLFS